MPQLAIAAVSAISVSAAGAITFSFSTFALNAALGFALEALTPKQSSVPAGRSYQGESVDSVAAHQIIYGRTKVGGVKVYSEETQNNKYLHKVVAFAGHTVESFDEIYLNDDLVTLDGSGNVTSPAKYSGYARIKVHLGGVNQAADSDLVSESNGLWSTNHRLRGIAYLYGRFVYNVDVFPNGEPVITAVIKGKKVYDPRTGITAWTSNSALCLRDYLLSKYSLNETVDNIDDDLFSAAADVCDEAVPLLAGGTEARYACDGAFLSSTKPVDAINAILVTMGGSVWFSQGKWRVKAAAWKTPVDTFDENDLRSGLSVTTRNSRRDNFNIVGGKFRGEESLWVESEYPEYRSGTFVDDDNGLESKANVDLLMVGSSPRAQRLAKIALYTSRDQIVVSGLFSLRAMSLQVGDIIYFNNTRMGWTAKTFEVKNWEFSIDQEMNLVVKMTMKEITPQSFDWTTVDESVFESNNTNLIDPFYVDPVGLGVSSEVQVNYEKLTNILYANVTSSDSSKISKVEVQYKLSSSSTWKPVGIGSVGQYAVVDIPDGTYDVRARSTNYLSVSSDWVVVSSYKISGMAESPTNVSSLSANLSGSNITLTWPASPDADLSHYIIRHSVAEAGATFANATTAAEKVSRPATSITLPARPGTYSIKSYDKTGNASAGYTSVIVPTNAMPTFANNPTIVKSTGTNFVGTKVNTSAASGELRLTSYGTAPSSGTYDINLNIDTTTPRRVTARLDIAVTRFADASGLWDSIPGLWDSWAGLWDDWTGAIQLADTDVVSYISITNDDPAGASPVWSDYVPFIAGEFYGRAFRFRVQLKSETAGVTPSISSITARVSY